MTSPRRKPDRPIKSVSLKIAFRADREETERTRKVIPWAVARGGVCEVRVDATGPGEAAEKVRVIMEKLRAVRESSKGFK